MDLPLIESLRTAAAQYSGIIEISPDETRRIATQIAAKHLADPSRILWWEGLKSQPLVLPYEDKDGLSVLSSLVNDATIVELIVTDEDSQPWVCFRGSVMGLLAMTSEQRYFEYMIADLKHEWVVFDTHHNELVLSGTIVETVKTITGGKPAR